jgi:hypothetical protein
MSLGGCMNTIRDIKWERHDLLPLLELVEERWLHLMGWINKVYWIQLEELLCTPRNGNSKTK